MNRYRLGLTERDIDTLEGILKKHPEVQEVWIFGSRAKGSYKAGSDIDLAVMNKGVSTETMSQIKGELEESSLPYRVDIVDINATRHADLAEHIKRAGMVFYQADYQKR